MQTCKKTKVNFQGNESGGTCPSPLQTLYNGRSEGNMACSFDPLQGLGSTDVLGGRVDISLQDIHRTAGRHANAHEETFTLAH
jgi:hypothetical protein